MFSNSPITLFLLLINILIGLYSVYMEPGIVNRMAFRPVRIRDKKEYYRIITGGFVHAGIGHLAFNLITLYFFGPYLEVTLGSLDFLIVYVGSLLAAHGLTYYMHRNEPKYSAVGASGAISGVVFAYCLFNPFNQIGLFMMIWIPAWLFALGFVGFSLYAIKSQTKGDGGRIAHEAHLGGAIGGLILTILTEPRSIEVFLRQIGL